MTATRSAPGFSSRVTDAAGPDPNWSETARSEVCLPPALLALEGLGEGESGPNVWRLWTFPSLNVRA